MIVHVVAFETPGSMGGHDWFYDPTLADQEYKAAVCACVYETVVHFKAEVLDGLQRDTISDLIDAYCWQHTLAELHSTTRKVAA